MDNHRYKQLKSILHYEQQTDKEIRCDIKNKIQKYEQRKHELI